MDRRSENWLKQSLSLARSCIQMYAIGAQLVAKRSERDSMVAF